MNGNIEMNTYARTTWTKNQDTMIAKFILDNPGLRLKDIELVHTTSLTENTFSVRRKIKGR